MQKELTTFVYPIVPLNSFGLEEWTLKSWAILHCKIAEQNKHQPYWVTLNGCLVVQVFQQKETNQLRKKGINIFRSIRPESFCGHPASSAALGYGKILRWLTWRKSWNALAQRNQSRKKPVSLLPFLKSEVKIIAELFIRSSPFQYHFPKIVGQG